MGTWHSQETYLKLNQWLPLAASGTPPGGGDSARKHVHEPLREDVGPVSASTTGPLVSPNTLCATLPHPGGWFLQQI